MHQAIFMYTPPQLLRRRCASQNTARPCPVTVNNSVGYCPPRQPISARLAIEPALRLRIIVFTNSPACAASAPCLSQPFLMTVALNSKQVQALDLLFYQRNKWRDDQDDGTISSITACIHSTEPEMIDDRGDGLKTD